MSVKPLPCPFCGGTTLLMYGIDSDGNVVTPSDKTPCIYLHNCKHGRTTIRSAAAYTSMDEAVKDWNRQVSSRRGGGSA